MGMAAGQARLLSITSRMSDNELRAQIINNNKMRLATESSQVSEAYVQALNEAQLMFTNYDKDNNASYQALTFNALTTYNPYNNQYALFNSAGNILVSEADAKKFKDANGNLNIFLKSYGLEETTTYWDNLKAHYDKEEKGIEYKIDDNTSAYIPGESADKIIDSLKKLYEGSDDVHIGYLSAKTSEMYTKYTTLVADYVEKRDAYLSLVADNMLADYEKMSITPAGLSAKTPSEILTLIQGVAIDEESMMADTTNKNNLNQGIKYVQEILEKLDKSNPTTQGKKTLETYKQILTNGTGANSKVSYSNGLFEFKDGALVCDDWTLKKSGNGYTFTYTGEDSSGAEKITTIDNLSIDGNGKFAIQYNNDGTVTQSSINDAYETDKTTLKDNFSVFTIPEEILQVIRGENTAGSLNDQTINVETKNTDGNKKDVLISILNSLSGAIYNIFDANKYIPDAASIRERAEAIVKAMDQSLIKDKNAEIQKIIDKQTEIISAFNLSVQEITKLVFGGSLPSNITNMDLDNIEKIHNALKGDGIDDEELKNKLKDKLNAFEQVYDVYLLDCIQNTYGEPNYSWIDTSNPNDSYNENGQAKKVWYENLFLRMQQSGYQVLLDGLASSKDWIKFAFDSGIVSMEQIDAYNNWNPIIYSNCSDITEQTNNAAIAKAEAEYNAAMNKIENKDKRYDLELKNIDTEHNSLQTEYDSIKGAVDKNIERTFKMYG